MKKREVEERIRLLEYENQILHHTLTEISRGIKIPPMPPFDRIEVHSLGCSWSLPGYEELRKKYRSG
jgi:hypothetical protein